MIKQRNLARKQTRTARVLLQRLDNKHLIPLLYFASKCFLAKDLAKQSCMGGVVALCGCPGSVSTKVA